MSGERKRSGVGVALALALSLSALTPGAAGQSGDKAMAESLFQAGRALVKEGKFDQACPKFAESQRIDPSAGTLLNLGKCLEALGKTASAWAAYKEAVALARGAGQAKQVTAGTGFIAEVEPKLSRLKIEAPSDIPGLTVKRDGQAIGAAAFGVSIAVDPGEHAIEASAPGRATWKTTVVVGSTADKKTVTIPALEPSSETDTPPPEATAAPIATAPATASTSDVAPPPPSGGGLRTVGFVTAGVGVAAIGVGAVLGVMTLGDASDAESDPELCPGKRCSDKGLDKIDGAKTKALVSTIALGAGVGLVGVGLALVIVGGKSAPASAARPRLLPTAGRDGGGLELRGAF